MEEESAQVSLPGAGETESLTVLEQQNLGLVTRIDKDNSVENPHVISEEKEEKIQEQIEEKIETQIEENLQVQQSELIIVDESEENRERPEGSDIKPPEEDNIVVESLEIATEEKSLEGETDDEVIERILKDSEEEVQIIQIDHLIPEETVPVLITSDNTQKSEDIPAEEDLKEDPKLILKEQDRDIPLDPQISAQIASFYEEDHNRENDRPPVPIQTYRWEDVRRAKQQGGYPWTHLYKQPLGPDDEPEVIFRYRTSPKNRRSFEEKLLESPKSEKRVRIDSEVSVQDCCYPDILEDDDPPVTEPNATETPTAEAPVQAHKKSFKSILFSPKSILKRSVKSERSKSLPPPDRDPDCSERKVRYCHPLVDKLKNMAEKQLAKTHGKKIKKIPLQESNKITLEEEQKILKLKESPKAKHKGFTSYEERQDSDDIVEIVELDESPGEARRRREEDTKETTSHVTPDEIIELPVSSESESKDQVSDEEPKKKIPRRQEHVYEDIQSPVLDENPKVILTGDTMDPSFLHDIIVPTDLKTSLRIQDKQLLDEVEYKRKPLDEITQSSEESQKSTTGLLAPICSVDSASDDERKPSLQAVVEESDTENLAEKVSEEPTEETLELKSLLKNEASPFLDKRVTFSPSTEDDPDLVKEDVHLEGLDAPVSSRWSKMR